MVSGANCCPTPQQLNLHFFLWSLGHVFFGLSSSLVDLAAKISMITLVFMRVCIRLAFPLLNMGLGRHL